MRTLLLLLVLSAPCLADPISGYTVMGTGGVSGPVSGFSDSSFSWVDTTTALPMSTLANYGYQIFKDAGLQASSAGSLLLSNSFILGATNTLEVNFSLITSQPRAGTEDFGFAIVLKDGHMVAVLGALRNDGINSIGDFGDTGGNTFLSPSAGVSTSTVTRNLSSLPQMTLGSQTYGTLVNGPGSCLTNCRTDFTSIYTPGAGTYQLMFGSGTFGLGGKSALAVTSVKVPEAASLAMTMLTLCVLGLALWRHAGAENKRRPTFPT